MVTVNWTVQAVNDLKSIYDFIANNSKRYADVQVNKILKSVELIKENNQIGRMVPEFQNDKIREIIKGNYRIVYLIVNQSQIDVVTVHHSSKAFKLDS